MRCPECLMLMEKFITFLCCHDEGNKAIPRTKRRHITGFQDWARSLRSVKPLSSSTSLRTKDPSMTSLLQKLLRKAAPPNPKLLASLTNPQTLNLTPPIITHPSHFINHDPNPIPQNPFFSLPQPENSKSSCSSLIFPSYPFGYFLNPISSTGSVSEEQEEYEKETIWADSVKKKRKRKMNKHKYKKLRKRLRRQT
ncbi:Mitochondrial mRNA-processing protein COX24, C-terminal [Dillenia turbinata]|uniref:Small ribosomal subunit protein mS38 n=1 Tax=Dillenia turbinata TaxID=194707 RepID=A0AAN8YXD8_9MAGN